MAILIDGYNLLNATGIIGRGIGAGTLERSRRALLNFIADVVGDEQRDKTTVVFDAKESPPGRPRTVSHRGLTVRFATGFADADELLEDLIRAEPAPRRLTVVSSDRRVQRAARRRRATAVDSATWYSEMWHQRHPPVVAPQKPPTPLSPAEVERWMQEFYEDGEPTAKRGDTAPPPKDESARPDATSQSAGDTELASPFPPGYAEDLLEE